eukprot:74931_1
MVQRNQPTRTHILARTKNYWEDDKQVSQTSKIKNDPKPLEDINEKELRDALTQDQEGMEQQNDRRFKPVQLLKAARGPGRKRATYNVSGRKEDIKIPQFTRLTADSSKSEIISSVNSVQKYTEHAFKLVVDKSHELREVKT